jgi:hypothetical protein
MSDIHLIQVTGRMEAEAFKEGLEDCGISTDDNVMIIDENVDTFSKEDMLYFLEEMARTLDVAEEMNIDWEEVYKQETIIDK